VAEKFIIHRVCVFSPQLIYNLHSKYSKQILFRNFMMPNNTSKFMIHICVNNQHSIETIVGNDN